MIENLSNQARLALQLAEQKARSFQHEYIGTEHLLLGLVSIDSGVAASVLRSHGLDVDRVDHEVKQLVQLGPEPVIKEELPLTPRARHALAFAEEDARMVSHSLVDTEHMLTGLLREPDGVAGVVLRKFGLQLAKLGAEVFKIRLLQMIIVERVMRPLQASSGRKRQMRDELLAHLSAIYDEELTRSKEPLTAVEAAGNRFGSPLELTAELQATIPRIERFEAWLEPIMGWRAPETATRWMSRLAIQFTLMMAASCAVAAIVALREFGWSQSVWLAIRPLVASTIALPITVATSGICYFKMRDNIFGVFGSQKSWGQAIAWATFLTVATVGCGFTFFTVAYGSMGPAAAALYANVSAGFIWALTLLNFARIYGPQGIRDTAWALLDLKDQPTETK